jgi:hypothetical protein
MNKKEKAKKDIEMAFDFARYLIEHPDEIEKLPDNSEVTFHERSDVVTPKSTSSRRKKVSVAVKRNFHIQK